MSPMSTPPAVQARLLPSRLTLGTVQLGLAYGVANRAGQPSAAAARAILERALELGVTSFDTAPAYGDAEQRLGEVVRGREVFVTSKLPSLTRAGVAPADVGRAVTSAVEASLAKLGRLDAYLLHDASDLVTYGGRLLDALSSQLTAGRIARAGVSVYGPDDVVRLLGYPELGAVQLPMSMLDLRMLPLLPRLRAAGIVTFARSAFLQGLYALTPDELPPRVAHARPWLRQLIEVTAGAGTTPLAAALPFMADVATDGGISSVVIGVDTVAQLEANVADFARPLPGGAALAAALRTRFAVVPADVVDPSRWPAEAAGAPAPAPGAAS